MAALIASLLYISASRVAIVTMFVLKHTLLRTRYTIEQFQLVIYANSCYKIFKELDDKGKRTRATRIRELLMRYGCGEVRMAQGVEGDRIMFVNTMCRRLKDCYQQEWYSSMHDMSKMSIYCTY